MSKWFARTRGDRDEWPGCGYRDDRQAKRAARAAGPPERRPGCRSRTGWSVRRPGASLPSQSV